MSSIRLASYSAVCWRPGKAGYVDVVGPIAVSEAAQRGGADGAAAIAVECITQPEKKLAVWLGWKGCKELKKSRKGIHDVLHVCTTATHSGVFFAHHHGERLGFALVAHDAANPEKMGSKPVVYSEGLAEVMADALPATSRVKGQKREKVHALLAFQQAVLRHTTEGHVLATIVTTRDSAAYVVVAHLHRNAWRKWRVDAPPGSLPCLHVPATGRDVRLLRCEVRAPVDPSSVATAPSAPLAFSALDRVCASLGLVSETGLRCLVVRELVFSAGDAEATVAAERCFQSHCFEGDVSAAPRPCLMAVDEGTAVYTVVVPCPPSGCCILHLGYAPGDGELTSSCAVASGLRAPLAASTLVVSHPHRPAGARLSLVLSEDMTLHACESFGELTTVLLSIDGADAATLTLPMPVVAKPSKKLSAFMADVVGFPVRLLPLQQHAGVLCTNGVVGLFLRVTSASFAGAAPVPLTAAVDQAGESGGAAALRQCLESLRQLSQRTTRHDLPDVVLRYVLPPLRHVGTTQQEVMLVQRVYEELLRMAAPNLESEWNYLWALTAVVQKTLSRRCRDNRLHYTDSFFLQLADAYRQSSFATSSGAAQVTEGVQAAVSAEAQEVIAAPPPQLPVEASYVLDGLAAGVAPVELAEEVARRLVRTETLTNGCCVVAAQPGAADCVHCMGCVLLASCLDLRVYVTVEEGGGVRVFRAAVRDGVCVAVQPHTFGTQAEFEAALVLASDLLCVSSADTSFRPDLALLALHLGGRRHCVAAFLQLFAPVLQHAVEAVAPLAENREWFEACVASLAQPPGEWAGQLLGRRSSDSATLAMTVCQLLHAPPRGLAVDLFHGLSRALPEAFCTTALVAILFHQTESLLAATQNYAASVVTHLAEHTSEAVQDAGWQAVTVGWRRLLASLAQTSALWAHVDVLSPYRVDDVAESYRISVANSRAAATGSGVGGGTMVSRTLVLCFRLYCLLLYTVTAEERARAAAAGGAEQWTADGTLMSDCERALEVVYLAGDSPVPLEWVQRHFLALMRRATALRPDWAPYIVRLLQLSNVRRSGSASLKREYYTLLDYLECRATTAAPLSAAQSAAIASAEAAATALAVQSEHRDATGADASAGHAAGSQEPQTAFLFAQSRDPSLPRWTNTHALPERRYLFSGTWTSTLWVLERVPASLRTACVGAVNRVRESAPVAPAGAPALSEALAVPLYAHLCRLRPPVRLHAVAGSTAASSAHDGGAEWQRQRSDEPADRGEQKAVVAAPALTQESQILPAAPAPVCLSELVAERPGGTTTTTQPTHPSVVQRDDPPAPQSVSTGTPAMAAEAAGRPALYSAADVAWWGTVEGTPPRQRRPLVTGESGAVGGACQTAAVTSAATCDDNGESSDTATTYTTSTSNYADPVATAEAFPRRPHGGRCAVGNFVEDGGALSSDSDAGVRDCQAGSAPRRVSPRHGGESRRCRCCSRELRHRYRGGAAAWSGGTNMPSSAAPVRVQWGDGAWETTATRGDACLRPAASTAGQRVTSPSSSRPALLTFSTRLQPPEQPPMRRPQSSRPAPAGAAPLRDVAPLLLTLPSAAREREGLRVRLYTLDGECARRADGHESSAGPVANRPARDPVGLDGGGALLGAPALPSSSVLVAPQALLRLPTREVAPAPAPPPQSPPAPAQAGDVPPGVKLIEAAAPYAQVPRAPIDSAPPAVDVATLQAPPPSAGTPTGAAQTGGEVASAPQGLPVPVSTLASAAPTGVPLSLPVPPLAVPVPGAPGVLSPAQLSDFRRYTGDLLAQQNAATAPAPAAPTPPKADAPAAAPLPVADGAGVARLQQQQEDFMQKATAILESRQAENEGFYRRVVESIRGLTEASQHLRGLSPVEQAQLVQSSVKQRNELLSLNHQLLDMQLAAARASGAAPPAATSAAASAATPFLRATSSGTTQTLPTPRESIGVSWSAPGGSVPKASVAVGASAAPPSQPHAGMQATLSDLQRLNTELMGVNASAEAMDRAIKETREVIQRYERNKTADALTAEGAALTAAMRLRTAEIERRLSDLPRSHEQLAAPAEPSPSPLPLQPQPQPSSQPPLRAWVSQSSATEAVGAPSPAEAAPAGPAAVAPPVSAAATAVLPAAPHFTAQSAASVSDTEAPHSVAATSAGQPQRPPSPSSPPAPKSTPPPDARAPGPPAATPPPSAVFTSVSSSAIEEAAGVSLRFGTAQVAAPPSVRFFVCEASAGGEAASGHAMAEDAADVSAGVRFPLHAPPSLAAPRSTAAVGDLRSLFVAAGGRYDVPRGEAAPVRERKRVAAAPPLRTSLVGSPACTPHAVRRRASPQQAHGDRYAMYRAPPHPSPQSRSTAASAPPISVAAEAPPPVARLRSTAGDAFVDRQQTRRMAGIAKRMEQLEKDLFA